MEDDTAQSVLIGQEAVTYNWDGQATDTLPRAVKEGDGWAAGPAGCTATRQPVYCVPSSSARLVVAR